MSTVLKIPQGIDWQCTWPVTPDPTGSTIRVQVRPSYDSDTVLHEWDSVDADVVTVDASGVTIKAPAEVSSEWTWLNGRWDLVLTESDGTRSRLDAGYAVVYPQVTR